LFSGGVHTGECTGKTNRARVSEPCGGVC
jgi:hypothetical protein